MNNLGQSSLRWLLGVFADVGRSAYLLLTIILIELLRCFPVISIRKSSTSFMINIVIFAYIKFCLLSFLHFILEKFFGIPVEDGVDEWGGVLVPLLRKGEVQAGVASEVYGA